MSTCETKDKKAVNYIFCSMSFFLPFVTLIRESPEQHTEETVVFNQFYINHASQILGCNEWLLYN